MRGSAGTPPAHEPFSSASGCAQQLPAARQPLGGPGCPSSSSGGRGLPGAAWPGALLSALSSAPDEWHKTLILHASGILPRSGGVCDAITKADCASSPEAQPGLRMSELTCKVRAACFQRARCCLASQLRTYACKHRMLSADWTACRAHSTNEHCQRVRASCGISWMSSNVLFERVSLFLG